MDVKNLSNEDFNKARMKASIKNITSVLKGKGEHQLLPFEEVKEISHTKNQSYIGIKTIPIELIAGSEGRYQDFDKAFLPKKEFSRHRWVRVNEARLTDIILPPIQVYELGSLYFVRDGNHRVSVAKMMGIDFVDAEIIRVETPINLTPDMTIEAIREVVLEYERTQFFSHPLIAKQIPNDALQFTTLGRYEEVWEHISVHRYYLGEYYNRAVSLEDAIISWYNTLYLPIVTCLEENNFLQKFSKRHRADLYIWVLKHWDELKKDYGDDVTIEKATADFTSRFGKSRIQRFFSKIKRGIKQFFTNLKRKIKKQ